jgi:hypothetical protein
MAGIPDARAMPIDSGSAIRKTTAEGGTSFTIALSLSFSAAIPGSFDLQAVARGSYSTGGGAGALAKRPRFELRLEYGR